MDTPSPANFLRAFFATRPGAEGVSLFDLLRGPEGSCFAGFDRFAMTAEAAHGDASEELLVGFHGTHLHTLWSIMREGMAESGPGIPGSRFFQLPKPDGTTADVSGVYCFQQSLRRKCLYYAVAVLFQAEPDAPQGPTAVRLVIELSFFRSSVNKRGKQTDQCIVQKATVRAIHVQVAPARQLELGTPTMTCPSLEAHPGQYVRLAQQTQVAGNSDPGGIKMLTLSDFDPARGGNQAGVDPAGTRLSISESATCLQRMPHSWSSPELIWLPKPLKVPDDPSRLRPIGLLTPIAKAAAASIRGLLMDGILASLDSIPQFAYLPGRDLNDALARVNHRMGVIRASLRFSATNRFDQRTVRENTRQGGRWLHPVCGGAVLSIDLHKAFDMVSREQLANTPRSGQKRRHSASTPRVPTISAWRGREPQFTPPGGFAKDVDLPLPYGQPLPETYSDA